MKKVSKVVMAAVIGFMSVGFANADSDNNSQENVMQTESFKNFVNSQEVPAGSVKGFSYNKGSVPSAYEKYGMGEVKADGQWVNDQSQS